MGYLENYDFEDIDEIIRSGIASNPNDYIPPLSDHENFKPVFGFSYMSLIGGGFCFNNPAIPVDDYHTFFLKCKEISFISYSELEGFEETANNRFHPVSHRKLEALGLDKQFTKLTDRRKSIPTLYQFALYTSKNRSPRIVGFVGKFGIFYLLWFDGEHLIYPRATP